MGEGLHDMHAYLRNMTDEEFRQLSARSHYSVQLSGRARRSTGNEYSARGPLSARGPRSVQNQLPRAAGFDSGMVNVKTGTDRSPAPCHCQEIPQVGDAAGLRDLLR